MNNRDRIPQLSKDYKIPIEILNEYEDEDEVWLANEQDRDLDTIPVPLPPTPKWETIENFGKRAKDQYFNHPKMPPKLIALQNEMDSNGNYLSNDECWEIIEEEKDYYREEIKFIKREWRRRLNGLWVFINGKATYIPPWMYFFLGYWQLPEGLPEYRQRDRKWFLFAHFCKDDKDCFGFIDIKHRRAGSTSKASCVNYAIASLLIRGRTGIQSMTEKSAEDVFQKHIIPGWRTMPFFFKPNTGTSDDPKKALLFSSAATKGKLGTKKRSRKSLVTDIGFRASGPKAFDGTQLWYSHDDEAGKTLECNILDRWRTKKMCLSKGANSRIHGLEIMTSTVGMMEGGGGKNLKELCDQSKYSVRNKNNQTASGLYIMFCPAEEGLEGFVGRYGESIILDPTPEQAEFIGKKFGAREYINNTIEHLKKIGDKDGLGDFFREHPQCIKDSFRSNSKDSFFNIPKIEERLDELEEMPTATIRGDFEWEGHKYRSKVRFVPNTESGKFYVSKVLSPLEANKVVWNDMEESFEPLNLKYCAGGDTFKANETKSKKNSKGAGAVYWGHDAKLDPFEKPMSEWVSARFICTYLHRPDDKEEYIEDMIMQCVYFGCPIYVETNVPDLREGFIKYGYRNMLVYKFDLTTEKFDSIAGQATNTTTKQEIFKLWQVQINRHCHREKHKDVLIQVRDIGGLDDMTYYDLFTAGGYAMKGFEQYAADLQLVTNPNQGANEGGYNLNDFFSEVNYG